jgi:magnesium transporter
MTLFNKRYHSPGTEPGTLPVVAPPEVIEPLCIDVCDYSDDSFICEHNVEPEVCHKWLDTPDVTWIHVSGHAEPAVMKKLGDIFKLHPLAMEDVLNTGQRPKMELYEEHVFVVASLPDLMNDTVTIQQVSLFFSKNYVISFCMGSRDIFQPVFERLNNGKSRLRKHGADYLLYALVDLVVDRGFPLLETFGEQLESLEQVLLEKPSKSAISDLHLVRRELLQLRQAFWAQRDMINTLLHDDLEMIEDRTRIYLRDCYDHSIQIMDLLEMYRDMMSNLLDIYVAGISNRLNEVMRVLAVIATIFIPPTFVVGVYGMNFDRSAGPLSMPELGWPYGYITVWAVVVAMIIGMLIYFKSKEWF